MTTYTVTVQGQSYPVEVKERRGTTLTFLIDGEHFSVSVDPSFSQAPRALQSSVSTPRSSSPSPSPTREPRATPNEIRAPIPGIVSDVKVSVGQSVESGATLVVIEAMKMENPIRAHRAGIVKTVGVAKGDEIASGTLLITFEDANVDAGSVD
jgi:biotin carboxyl carrier protein